MSDNQVPDSDGCGLSIQEMFNRAWLGLKSQDWLQCRSGQFCRYSMERQLNGSECVEHHCAWGWVDPERTRGSEGAVENLRNQRCGLAAGLNHREMTFARELQRAHDYSPAHIKERMEALATSYSLTIPVGV